MGKKGAMKELAVQAQDIGFQSYHIQTTTGTIQIKEKQGHGTMAQKRDH